MVTGATGQQGKALIQALRPNDNSTPTFHVLALTRKATSPSAKDLGLEKHVTVVEGDLDSPESIRKIFEAAKDNGGVWGVFCVLAYPGLGANADGEERQGKVRVRFALHIISDGQKPTDTCRHSARIRCFILCILIR